MNEREFRKNYTSFENLKLVNAEPLTVNFMRENRFPYSGSNFVIGLCTVSSILCGGISDTQEFLDICDYFKVENEHLWFLTVYHSLPMTNGVIFAKAVLEYPRERANNKLTDVDFKLILDTLARST